MVDVLGVHGMGQQQLGRAQLLTDWSPAIRDGLERVTGARSERPTLDIGFYGDVFLVDSGTKGPGDVEWELDEDVLQFLEEIQEEWAEDLDVDASTKGMPRLPGPLRRLAATLDRRFGVAGKLLFFGDLPQVRRYQRDDDLAARIRARVQEGLTAGSPSVLLGHSLGSVVAYEALCMTPDHGIDTFITIGSPLGLTSIRAALRPEARDRLPDLPPGVTRWLNVYDPKDAVALAGGLGSHWKDVEDATVDNGDGPHAATRYLGKRAVGQPIATRLGLS